MQNCRRVAVKCTVANQFRLLLVIVYFVCLVKYVNYECDLSDCIGFITSAKEVMFSSLFLCLSGSNFAQKLLNGFA